MDKFDKLFNLNYMIQNAFGKILCLFRINKFIKDRKYFIKNKNLTKYRKTNTCYILGLGPSLSEIDLSKIEDDIIVTNRFNRFDNKQEVKPTYYVLSDNAFFEGDSVSDLSEALKQYPESAFVLNGKFRKNVEKIIETDNDIFHAYYGNGIFTAKSDIKSYDGFIPAFGNVVCAAIYLAISVGYKEIVLLGCDFNSFASSKAEHCYKENNNERKWDLGYELFCYSFVAKTHREFADYAKENNIKIINGTTGSLIDAYERIKF